MDARVCEWVGLILVLSLGLFSSVGLPCPAFKWWFLFHLILFYFILFACYPLEASSSIARDRNGVNPEGRGGEGTGKSRGWESYSQYNLYEKRICFFFNKNGKFKKSWQNILMTQLKNRQTNKYETFLRDIQTFNKHMHGQLQVQH